ncbi:MAG: hypothetical protein AAGC55_26395, partial [Myxococcota bacterium]
MGGKPRQSPAVTRVIAPPPPVERPTVASAWKRIEGWLGDQAPSFRRALATGATPFALARAEQAMGVRLPPHLSSSLMIHDGEGFFVPTGLIGGWSLMSSHLIARDYLRMIEMLRSGAFG